MRCKNCGWPNKPGLTTCSKCNAPLTEASKPQPVQPTEMIHDDFPDLPMPGAVPPPPTRQPQGQINLNGTVLESDIFPDQAPVHAPAPAPTPAPAPVRNESPAAEHQCPKCGYPLRPDAIKCPNCRSLVGAPAPASATPAPEAPEAPKPSMQRQATVGVFDAVGKVDANITGTINPLVQRIVPEFALTLQPRDGEKINTTPLEFEGDSVSLNRNNVEPANNSITSKEQAVIYYEDGKWYIEDRSAFKTTFVQAGHKTELHNGDTILMGSRMMTFNCDEK